MATIEFFGALPPVEEFIRQLREAEDQYDPVEKLLALGKELTVFEQKYGMASAEFFQRFETGELGDAMDYFRWIGRYEAYLRLKKMISASLDIVVSENQLALA